jgi:DNA repair exonuclease SbcCD ATPase subunit
MKILNLKSENLKGIKVIDITPKDNMVIISGKNGAGKTSAIDSMWYALIWKAGSKGTPMPIRKGEKFARVQVTLCEDLTEEDIAQGKTPKVLFIVTRNWTSNDKTYLKVIDGRGIKYTISPQKLLDDFIGYLSVDPREFTTMSGKEHRDILVRLTGFDISAIEAKIAELKELRTIKGREVKLLAGEREQITIEDLPEELISVTDINNELQEAMIKNTKIDESIRTIANYKLEVERLKNEITSCEVYVDNNKRIPTDSLKEKLNDSQEINEQIRAKIRNEEADKKENKAKAEYEEFGQGIKKEITKMEDGLKANWHKVPDQKLSLTETDIAYNGIPYSQISFSEQLRVAMKIAMASGKELSVISISDYSLLDDENKAVIRKMAKEFNCQVWAEEVDDTGTKGFYIEEGEVKSDNDSIDKNVPF